MSDKPDNASSDITPAADHELDACGLYCPEPVMLLHNKIREIDEGSVLLLKATDPSTTRDVPKFCLYLDHELIKQEQKDDQYHYWIRKQAD